MPSRIAVGCGVNTNKALDVRAYTGFLQQFPHHGRFDGFSIVDEASRQGELSLEGRILPADQQQSPGRVKEDGVNRECW